MLCSSKKSELIPFREKDKGCASLVKQKIQKSSRGSTGRSTLSELFPRIPPTLIAAPAIGFVPYRLTSVGDPAAAQPGDDLRHINLLSPPFSACLPPAVAGCPLAYPVPYLEFPCPAAPAFSLCKIRSELKRNIKKSGLTRPHRPQYKPLSEDRLRH